MRAVVMAIGAALAAGCGGSGLAPVSGTVTRDGSPVPGARVHFQPAPEPPVMEPGLASDGVTDAAGRFTLTQTLTAEPGAVIGRHRVSVTAGDAGGGRVLSPADLTADVPTGGTRDLVLDLPTGQPQRLPPGK